MTQQKTLIQQGDIKIMDTQITFSPVTQDLNKSSETLRDEIRCERLKYEDLPR